MVTRIELQKRLDKLEKQLEKVRGCSPLTHGWQTQRLAKASRSWDMLAQEKMRIKNLIDEIEAKNYEDNQRKADDLVNDFENW
jgi:ABC-type uncharacterized transport system ATPase subunit